MPKTNVKSYEKMPNGAGGIGMGQGGARIEKARKCDEMGMSIKPNTRPVMAPRSAKGAGNRQASSGPGRGDTSPVMSPTSGKGARNYAKPMSSAVPANILSPRNARK